MYPPCRAAGKRRLSSAYHYIKGYREKQFLSFPSAEGKRFRRSGGLPPQATLRPWRAWALAAFGGRGTPCPRRRDCRCPPAENAAARRRGQKGERTPMVSFPPLNSPNLSFKPRLPSVARLKARGPQGRLVLQGTALDRSGSFPSTRQTPCTVWPRTVMRGELRKKNSGQ